MKKTTEIVKKLYEEFPYPNRNILSKEKLIHYSDWIEKLIENKEEKNIQKNFSFWKGKKVLDSGCGTGEASVSIALKDAQVYGIDLSESSIAKAKILAQKMNVEKNATFQVQDILQIPNNQIYFKQNEKKFDVVMALGSLHHTADARKAFEIISKMVKSDGLIVFGLYNKYSRARHRIKRILLKLLCGNNIHSRMELAKKLFKKDCENRPISWLADKYGQVHESYHSFSEMKKWLIEEGFEFVNSEPKITTPLIDEIKLLLEKKSAFITMVGKKQQK
jgi:2-polyprenyl-3-methyl-5-hydroxy-6-metoxy-1,4-benzoquinol methylase